MRRRSRAERVLTALHQKKGSMMRSSVIDLFFRHVSAARLNALLEKELAGLVVQERKPFPPRRRAIVWSLTAAGWAAANVLEAEKSPLCLDSEEIKRQIVRLVSEGDPWAKVMLEAKRFWDKRPQSRPVLSKDQLIDELQHTMTNGASREDKMFARVVLRRVNKALAPDPPKPVERPHKRRRPKGPLTPEEIERINRAREKHGEPPLGAPRTPEHSRVSPESKASVQPSEPKPLPHPIVGLGRPENVFQFPSGRVFRHGSFGGEEISIRTLDGKNYWNGKEVRVIPTDVRPNNSCLLDYETGMWKSTTPLEPPRPGRGIQTPASFAPDPAVTADDPLLSKIKAAGYQTNSGRVLYDNREWLAPGEWVKRTGWSEQPSTAVSKR